VSHPLPNKINKNDLFSNHLYRFKVYESKLYLITVRHFSGLNGEPSIHIPHNNGCLDNICQENNPKMFSISR